ncbi:hypothetical protein ACWCXH_03865 [Kitasatospora sp. NPDC001660]
MARIHTRRAAGFLVAAPLVVGLLLAGAGAAAADNGAAAGAGSNADSNAGVDVVFAPIFR